MLTNDSGWRFATPEDKDAPGANVTGDPVPGHENYTHLKDIYFQCDPDYQGRFTVPTLYDKKQHKIVSNESSEIIRMFYTEFDDLLPERYKNLVLYPEHLRAKIDEHNDWHYNDINNGVYKSGFATTQEAYEKNAKILFAALDKVEKHLATSEGPYYWGKEITETDVRLVTTIVRYDPVCEYSDSIVVEITMLMCHRRSTFQDQRQGYPIRVSAYSSLVETPVLAAAGSEGYDRVHPHQAPLHQEPQANQPFQHHTSGTSATNIEGG
jgi:hypothetical protein